MDWLAFVKARGPIGGPRENHLHALSTMAAAGPFGEEQAKKIKLADFYPWWVDRDQLAAAEAADDEDEDEDEDDELDDDED